ncbi:Cupin domain-containing protein [Granulicella pectinivorans]|uniref:Cupin domain-containing protein n=1 Tax=Granulicella pectinivorans TaxID=474950 RepID=A0A1I6LR75_9BACT|nr:cupin domain-containing protein [Granulicella pectinivorans]SFS06007.1 Cupin domain-containing protein [Granulicella pectinivorans]
MPATPISRGTAEHYRWGGDHNDVSDGWYLVRTPALNIIEERLPPAAFETRHYHKVSRQFFYVLEGELTMEIEHHVYVLKAGEGVEIAPGQAHQAANHSKQDLSILVTSQPPSHGDRYEAL